MQLGPDPLCKTHISELSELKGEKAGIFILLLPLGTADAQGCSGGFTSQCYFQPAARPKCQRSVVPAAGYTEMVKVRGYGQGTNNICYNGCPCC